MTTTQSCGDLDHTAAKLIEDLIHIFVKLEEIHDKFEECDAAGEAFPPRLVMQFGYNAGRLSELIGAGRNVWDSFKGFLEPGQLWSQGPAGYFHDTIERWIELASIELGEDQYFLFNPIRKAQGHVD